MKCKSTASHRRFNTKITLQRLSGTADAAGHIDGNTAANWSVYATAWAEVKSRGGREFWKVSQVQSDVDFVFVCPWSRTMESATPDMRIICSGNTYEIISVINVDLANDTIELQTRRRTT
jgi:SPP1 family predicted phage head-tail adaptor